MPFLREGRWEKWTVNLPIRLIRGGVLITVNDVDSVNDINSVNDVNRVNEIDTINDIDDQRRRWR